MNVKAHEHKDLQELLPAYLESSLGQEMQDIVERHLSSCKECRAELALLRTMAAEPVPDPGEAFWTAFPGRVYREIEQQHGARPHGTGGLMSFLVPRWAWAAALVVMLGALSWYVLLPAPIEMAGQQTPDSEGAYVDVLASDQVSVSELSSPEIDSLDSWANAELASLQVGVTDMLLTAPDGAIEERLDEMNAKELEHLSSMLDADDEEV